MRKMGYEVISCGTPVVSTLSYNEAQKWEKQGYCIRPFFINVETNPGDIDNSEEQILKRNQLIMKRAKHFTLLHNIDKKGIDKGHLLMV